MYEPNEQRQWRRSVRRPSSCERRRAQVLSVGPDVRPDVAVLHRDDCQRHRLAVAVGRVPAAGARRGRRVHRGDRPRLRPAQVHQHNSSGRRATAVRGRRPVERRGPAKPDAQSRRDAAAAVGLLHRHVAVA